jgi:hypothetical protein
VCVRGGQKHWLHLLDVFPERYAEGAAQTPQPAPAGRPDRMNIEPTPSGYRAIGRLAEQEQARYARLADRLARLLDAAQRADRDDDDVAAR